MTHKLAIIIVNYKTPDLIIDCLESMRLEIADKQICIRVIDNCSNDNSVKKIHNWISLQPEEHQQNIQIIASEVNAGFSAGNNLGIKSIGADYYLLLNSDTLVRPGAIQKLIAEADESSSNVAAISPRLEWPNGTPQESCFRFHTPFSEFIKSAKTGLITKLMKRYVIAQPVSEWRNHYDWMSFACILIKKKIFDEIGYLDDGFFMYFEDVDFCYRVKRAGWKILYIPQARVVHLRGGSSSVKTRAKLRKRLPRYYYESRARFYYKTYGCIGLLAANILWTLGYPVTVVRNMFSKDYQSDTAEKEWCDIWTNFFSPLKPYTHPDNYDKT